MTLLFTLIRVIRVIRGPSFSVAVGPPWVICG